MRTFPLVEVQQTFYEPPAPATLAEWRAEAPPDFEFTLKAWQLITHESRSPTYRRLKRKLSDEERTQVGAFKPTPIVHEAWQTTAACAEALNARYILFQTPASFIPSEQHVVDLHNFFARIECPTDVQLLWEPRGKWPAELVQSLCQELNLVHVVDPFLNQSVTPELPYYRIQGRDGFRYEREDSDLERLLAMMPARGTSYVLFNSVSMMNEAKRFHQMVRAAGRAG